MSSAEGEDGLRSENVSIGASKYVSNFKKWQRQLSPYICLNKTQRHWSFIPHSDGKKDSPIGNKNMANCPKHIQEQGVTYDKLRERLIENILYV